MRILMLDIETAPNLVYAWGLWNQTISIEKIVKPSYILCWAAKWYGTKKMMFASCQKGDHEAMIREIHALLDEADVVVHYNGQSFDIPKLNQEFAKYGLKPPSPFKQVDLFRVVKKNFDLPSSKLEYVVQYFKLGAKVKNAGMELWIGCMNGVKQCWKDMEKYNRGDVSLLDVLYEFLMPWIDNHPNQTLYGGKELACVNCGSTDVQKRGLARSSSQVYQRYQCNSCGRWLKGRTALKEQKKNSLR